MIDRELLKAAAKAAGLTIGFTPHTDECYVIEGGEAIAWWNPLTDDGDAMRLAVWLGMTVQRGLHVQKVFVGINYELAHELIGTDPCAATRRAIVRAAAATVKA